MVNTDKRPPLVAHVIHHLVTGGMENGLVNLVNLLPEGRYRHAIFCMMDYSDFRFRIRRKDTPVFAMHKGPGHDWRTQLKLWKLFRELRPSIVHGRSLGALDCLLPAAMAGVKIRIFGEHGWDERDPAGLDRRRIWLRRLHSPLVTQYVALSGDLARYLTTRVGVAPDRVTRVYNGVDLLRFTPERSARALLPEPFRQPDCFIVGTVGRLQPVKDQENLAHAFVSAVRSDGEARRRMRLVIVGNGPRRGEISEILRRAGVESLSWLAGDRSDVAELLKTFDLFVLPSMAEGISNTILEAMATALPVVATRVGGNPELVEEGVTGRLVRPGDSAALSSAMRAYLADRSLCEHQGLAGRERVEKYFSLEGMVANYDKLYSTLLTRVLPEQVGLQAA